MAKLMFHVRHNARPDLVKEILLIIEGGKIVSIDDILEIGKHKGYQIGTTLRSIQSIKENPLQTARDLGLISYDELTLTDFGIEMVNLLHFKPTAFNELMHIFHYILWNPERKTENCFSWSYSTVSDLLWECRTCEIDRGQLVSQVSEMAIEKFHTNGVSFSKDSVRGVLQWLYDLEPSVLDNKKKIFSRRNFCPPETFVIAVEHLYKIEGADYHVSEPANNPKFGF